MFYVYWCTLATWSWVLVMLDNVTVSNAMLFRFKAGHYAWCKFKKTNTKNVILVAYL